MTGSLVKGSFFGILASAAAWEGLVADNFAERRNAAQLSATRMLTGHGRPTQAAWLRELADWIEQAHGGTDPLPTAAARGPR